MTPHPLPYLAEEDIQSLLLLKTLLVPNSELVLELGCDT